MKVTLELWGECPDCGGEVRGISWRTVRVNRKTLSVPGRGIVVLRHPTCPDCGAGIGLPDLRWARLDADSAERVRAYRAQRWSA